ncbi:MAG: DUF3109 family protein [Cytophagaceae bacterium]|nr:DUF3109 family protein [Cytophagaceae bacterium]MDW8455763.1 DUF3109 family protein [Cytophagaceae bacterium]
MLKVQDILVSDEILQNYFVCDLIKCKGACCTEGDLGAPLAEDELSCIDEILETVWPYLSEEAQKTINSQGPYIIDYEGDYSTSTVHGRECVFAYYDQNNILRCAIEKAWSEGKIKFRKPISCHLYPIRISKNEYHEVMNYHRWHICHAACHKGKALGVPLYVFLKEPLIRQYGEDWYNELVSLANVRQSADE